MNLICPKCNYSWNYKGNHWRATCPNCKEKTKKTIWVKTGIPFTKRYTPNSTHSTPNSTHSTPNLQVQDNILNGNILDALDQTEIDPFNNQRMFKDFIPILLGDDETRYAFARACDEKRKSPRAMVKVIIKSWLKEKEFL